MKKAIYSKLIKMFFTNMRINIEPRMQDRPIVFCCDTLGEILGISNEGPRVFKVKVIRTIERFVYN